MSYFITLQTFSIKCAPRLFPGQSSNDTVAIPDLCLLLYFWYKHLEPLLTGCVFHEYYIDLGDLLILTRSKALQGQLT